MSETVITSSPSSVSMPVAPTGGFAAISKYNPHLWSAEQLRAIFVARQAELADLLTTIRNTPIGAVGQHTLLVGARGMGKSTLMQRLALAVEDDTALGTQWLALRFPEEQYTVRTLGQFWANVLDALADALERSGISTHDIDSAAARIAALPHDAQAQAYLDELAVQAKSCNKRFLLLVDNTDLLLGNIGKQAHWALRQVLQSQSHLLWVGGSYQSLEANSEYHDAFLDFFRVLELRPLQLHEMQAALLALAQTFGGEAVHQHMQRQLREQPERLATLRQLSGGNPRTTVMLYTLLANAQDGKSGNVRSDLEALLDEMTPLYKARLDNLADVPRKLLAHILEHWAPISLGDLERASQEKATSISPQLKRLELEGLIERVKLHGTTRSGYQAAERFFNIWYLMRLSPRRQRSKLMWLVEFMRMWFSSVELQGLARGRMGLLTGFGSKHLYDLEYDRALAEALPEGANERHALRWDILKQIRQNQEQLSALFDFEETDQEFKGADDYLRRLNALPALLRQCPHPKTEEEMQEWVEGVMGCLSLSLVARESIAKGAKDMSSEKYFQTMVVNKSEPYWFSSAFNRATYLKLKHAVLAQDFFPDFPSSQLASLQIRTCFTEDPDAAKFACSLMLEVVRDSWTLKTLEWVDETLLTNFFILYRAEIRFIKGEINSAKHLCTQAVNSVHPHDYLSRLQAQLILGNQQLATDALHHVVEKIKKEEALQAVGLKELIYCTNRMGLGETLADWMQESQDAQFLQPFIQALYTLSGATSKLKDLPQEVQQMADEVVKIGLERAKRWAKVQT